MKKLIFTGSSEEFINNYDGVTYQQWNLTKGPILKIRKTARDHYLEEQKFRCAYCRIEKKERHGMTWDVEHIIPKATYPEFMYEPENLTVSCKECNIAKDNKNVLTNTKNRHTNFPRESKEYSIIHPHYDSYSQHIEIIAVQGKIIHRPKNNNKAKETFIQCDLIRFSYSFAEWDDFNLAVTETFCNYVKRCPEDATKEEIARFVKTIDFTIQADF